MVVTNSRAIDGFVDPRHIRAQTCASGDSFLRFRALPGSTASPGQGWRPLPFAHLVPLHRTPTPPLAPLEIEAEERAKKNSFEQ